MKKISRGKFVIIILIFFLLGGTAFFFLFRKEKSTSSADEPVIVPTAYIKQSPIVDTSSWKTFTDNQLNFIIKYPTSVTLDSRQTVAGRLDVFIFESDKKKPQVPALYIANTYKTGTDGFSAFRKGDCKKPCPVSYKTVDWVNINNVYGIENPLPGDMANYYLTDKDQQGLVINAYVGGYNNTEDNDVKTKIDMFEQIIRTIQFETSKSHGHTK